MEIDLYRHPLNSSIFQLMEALEVLYIPKKNVIEKF